MVTHNPRLKGDNQEIRLLQTSARLRSKQINIIAIYKNAQHLVHVDTIGYCHGGGIFANTSINRLKYNNNDFILFQYFFIIWSHSLLGDTFKKHNYLFLYFVSPSEQVQVPHTKFTHIMSNCKIYEVFYKHCKYAYKIGYLFEEGK